MLVWHAAVTSHCVLLWSVRKFLKPLWLLRDEDGYLVWSKQRPCSLLVIFASSWALLSATQMPSFISHLVPSWLSMSGSYCVCVWGGVQLLSNHIHVCMWLCWSSGTEEGCFMTFPAQQLFQLVACSGILFFKENGLIVWFFLVCCCR